MNKRQTIQRLVSLSFVIAALAPLSLFADERPDWRTNNGQYETVRNGDLRGTVVSVSSDGDDFTINTRNQRVRIDASGGVPAYFNGRRMRIRDLRPGDVVTVSLRSTRDRYLKASSVEVLRTSNRNPYNDRYDQGSYDRISGQIIAIDSRRDLLTVRTSDGRQGRADVVVNVRQMSRGGTDWGRGLRTGDYVTMEGTWNGRTFVAQRLTSTGSGYDRGRR